MASPSRTRVTSSSYHEREDHHGFLNRKSEGAMGRKTKVLLRDKGWQLFWCNLKGTQFEFYKVEGGRNKEPPRDVYPPANLTKIKPEILDVHGALVEIDYISQENKDIQKRRRFLFRLEQNNMEYIFQAPSANQHSLWVKALQRASGQLSVGPESSLVPGHAIRAIRDSIKHTRRQAVHRTRSPGHTGVQGGTDDADYIEFSSAEARVASGGDFRLQALRKRLQAKKELLKQLDRMYSTYLGGNAAAMYDDSLILQQQEAPTFSNEASNPGESPDGPVQRSSQSTYKVIHHKLSLNGEGPHQNGHSVANGNHGFDKMGEVDGMAHDTPSGPAEEIENRNSSCDIGLPPVMATMSSSPESEEVLTELLIDYYLVPGAPWSLLRKGEPVKVLGRSRETGWYRCMALRKAQIELDHSAFSFLDQYKAGDAGAHRKSKSWDVNSENTINSSGDVPFSPSVQRPPLSSFSSTISSTLLSPLHLSLVSSCSLSGLGRDEGLFNLEALGGTTHIGLDNVDGGGDRDNRCSLGADLQAEPLNSLPEQSSFKLSDLANFSIHSVEDDLIPFSTDSEMSLSLASARMVNVQSFEEEVADCARPQSDEEGSEITDSMEQVAKKSLGGTVGAVVLRKSLCLNRKVMRPVSYQLATDQAEKFGTENGEEVNTSSGDTERGGEDSEEKGEGGGEEKEVEAQNEMEEASKKGGTVKRSTSTITTSSPAVINLRRTIGIRTPRSQSSTSGYSLPANFAAMKGLRKSFLMGDRKKRSWSKLDKLIELELVTGTYPAPLIGCIAPSALKCFAEKVATNHSAGSEVCSAGGTVDGQGENGISAGESAAQSQNGPTQSGETFLAWNPISSVTQISVTDPEHSSAIDGTSAIDGSTKQRQGMGQRKNSRGTLLRSQQHQLSFNSNISMEDDDDSDGEADRRQALLFNSNSIINPDDDVDILMTLQHVHIRTRSLPPSMQVIPASPKLLQSGGGEESWGEHLGDIDVESSLDCGSSYLRRMTLGKSLDSTELTYLDSHSVGSSPTHRPTKAQPPPTRLTKASGKVSSPQEPPSVSGLFESMSPSRTGVFKKLFSRKTKPQQQQQPRTLSPNESFSGRLSPGLLRQVLLDNVEPEQEAFPYLQVASGRVVRQEGMAIVIGDDSSSESEVEEYSAASSLQDDLNFSSQHGRYSYLHDASSPLSPITPYDDSMLSFGAGRGREKGEGTRDQEDDAGKIAGGDLDGPPLFQSKTKLKRSVSDHVSLKLKDSSDPPAMDSHRRSGSGSSLKRNMSLNSSFRNSSFVKLIKKTTQQTTTSTDSPGHRVPSTRKSRFAKKKKKRPASAYVLDQEEGPVPCSLDQNDPTIKMTGIFRQPPRGELRHVYLETSDGKYGFRLQSYGRINEQGKVLQTFVQSVAPGTPAFLAGLYPGDAIVEVGGVNVKYAPVESVVDAIKKGTDKGERVQLKVEFVDGVTRLDCMRKAEEFKSEISRRQNRLKELLEGEKHFTPVSSPMPSPTHVISASKLPVWEESTPTFEGVRHKFPFNRQLNQVVAVHSGNILELDCEVLVMPISSCHKPKDSGNKNLLLQLLRTGGARLMDDLSLAKQCKVGDNIVTWGHALPAKYIYHCMFGDLEESLQSCCYKALEGAVTEKLRTVVFWLDGFASLSVSPHLVIEAVRNWMQQDGYRHTLQRVVFSSKANCTLVEQIMRNSFPLYPQASRDSGVNFSDVHSNESSESRSESLQNEMEASQNGTEPFQNGFGHVQNGIESPHGRVGEDNKVHRSSQADRGRSKMDDNSVEYQFTNQNKNTDFVENGGKSDPKLEASPGSVSSPSQSVHSLPFTPTKTLASSHNLESLAFFDQESNFTPRHIRLSTSSNISGDLLLNPDRTESEV